MHFLISFWTENETVESQIFLCEKYKCRKTFTKGGRNEEKFNYWKFHVFSKFPIYISRPFKKSGNMTNLHSLADKSP